ncbi:DUF6192 family protein [Streptomyces sp. KL118A]|uniref:DUF6192 family protein n=1 Tax=Streptomyces sp. KL118A TaxID=3045153 RepID=UPI00278C04D3|nr:DUF6192 family protein [Streptomyces sp. KL118A]
MPGQGRAGRALAFPQGSRTPDTRTRSADLATSSRTCAGGPPRTGARQWTPHGAKRVAGQRVDRPVTLDEKVAAVANLTREPREDPRASPGRP